jgi:hypothetical protein
VHDLPVFTFFTAIPVEKMFGGHLLRVVLSYLVCPRASAFELRVRTCNVVLHTRIWGAHWGSQISDLGTSSLPACADGYLMTLPAGQQPFTRPLQMLNCIRGIFGPRNTFASETEIRLQLV